MADDTKITRRSGITEMRKRIAVLRTRLERLLLWRVWERMLEIEFIDRSVALAGKAFVSFFPLVVVVAAFMPERIRSSILTAVTARLGIRGDALTLARDAFASSDDIRQATGVLGLVLTIFFATSFTTALQRMYLRAWRRPPRAGAGAYWRGVVWLLVALACMALLGGLRGALGDGLGFGLFAIVTLAVIAGQWWFTAWFLLLGEVRARVLVPTGVITSIVTAGYAASATVWMPRVVTSNEAQFGFFGVALSLVTWFSGAAICVLIGACAGPGGPRTPGGSAGSSAAARLGH
jgi:membrane protein